jgi:hypothetical protein
VKANARGKRLPGRARRIYSRPSSRIFLFNRLTLGSIEAAAAIGRTEFHAP